MTNDLYTCNKRVEFQVMKIHGGGRREFAISPLGFGRVPQTDDNVLHVKLNKKV